MLKYKSILDKLTDDQKAALLSDVAAFSDPHIASLGVPPIRTALLSSLAAEAGMPSYASMAAAWDLALIGQVTQAAAVQARAKGANLFVTPDLKCTSNDAVRGLSEDAFFNGETGAAMARAVRAAGGACAYARLACDEKDVACLDVNEDARAMYDLVRKPFVQAAKSASPDAIVSSLDRPCGGYLGTNVRLFSDIVAGEYGKDVVALSQQLAPDVDYHAFLAGSVCLGGGGVALSRALGRYRKLAQERAAGSVSERELQGAEADGIAVPPAAADAAADRMIDFAYRVNKIVPAAVQSPDLRALGLQAARESIVLLKNRGILPLKAGTRIAVVGEACDALQGASALPVVARAAGYSRAQTRAEDVCEEAVRAAKDADVIVIFLQPTLDEAGEVLALSLPANLLSLIAALRRTGKRMLGILPSDCLSDMSFDADFDAVLTAPLESRFCGEALGEILSGAVSPVGRLTRSRYDHADARVRVICADRDSGRTRIGAFVGYRYYDTAGMKVRYPFGYGLTYTKFVYSGLHVGDGEVRFTVRNVGKRAGCEVAQLYVGAPGFPMPGKELKGFVRVPLEAGEAREVAIPLPQEAFARYDPATHGESVAEGKYAIFVGASVTDIRLRGVKFAEGERPAEDTHDASTYFSDLSNIGQTYRLSAARGALQSQRRRWFRIGALGVLFAILVAYLVMGFALFEKTRDPADILTELLVFSGLLVVDVAALIAENAHHRSAVRRANEQRKLAFDDPVLKTSTAPEVFESAFFVERDTESGGVPSDEPKYFDRAFTFSVMSRQLAVFLTERGMVLSDADLRSLLAAFACSRILIFPAESEARLNALCTALSAYFGTQPYAETMDAQFRYDGNFIRGNRGGGLSQAIIAAWREPSRMFVALCRHADPSGLIDLRFARTPEHAVRLQTENADGSKVIVPPNLWIAVMPADGRPAALPKTVADMASVLDIDIREGREIADKTAVRTPGSYQFANLCEAVRGTFALEERLWKRVDRLEERIGEKTSYRIGNRIWIKMERFISVYLACGGSDTDALDRAVATQLLFRILGLMPVAKEGTEALASLLEEVFGAEEIGTCRKMLARVNQGKKEKGSI